MDWLLARQPATEAALAKVEGMVGRGTLRERGAIGIRVGPVSSKYKVATHVAVTIADRALQYAREPAAIAAEAELDGISVIRLSDGRRRSSGSR